MAEQIEQVVKRGRWLYDETVPAEVYVVRRNFVDPHPEDDEAMPSIIRQDRHVSAQECGVLVPHTLHMRKP